MIKYKEREPFASFALYHFAKWSLVNPLFRTYFRGKIYGGEKVPQSGSLIVVSNHASDFDPPLLSNAVRRPVAFMAKEELFQVPVLKQTIKLYGAYPVKRGKSDRASLKAAMSALENGWIAGIFLDGTRTPDAKITNPKLGAALIAAKTQVPLIPVSLWGTEKIFQPGSYLPRSVPITIRIADVISPPQSTQREELQAVTDHCAEVINQMHALGR
ncbi:MAG: lysophospholipid acyltransferase family protein [Stanieria sp.]